MTRKNFTRCGYKKKQAKELLVIQQAVKYYVIFLAL